MAMEPAPTDGARILLLAADPAWSGLVRVAAPAGVELVEAASPRDAVSHLVRPKPPFSHLLLEARAAGSFLDDLVGLTVGEPGTATTLVWLGTAPAGAMQGTASPASAAALALLLARGPASQQLPALGSRELANAIARGEIVNHYQPIVGLDGRELRGFEALARWRHPAHGTLPPDAFIALAERAGLGGFLTEDVTIRALADLAGLPTGPTQPRMGINFPLDVLLVRETLARLDAARKAAGLPAERVTIELTESRPVDDVRALRHAAERLRGRGYRLAIDDVGPAIADYRRLFELPFNSMKLDKDIVCRSATQPEARAFVERAIADGKERGLLVIAEGVESPGLWRAMRAAGADLAQGFMIGRALPIGAIGAWEKAWLERSAAL